MEQYKAIAAVKLAKHYGKKVIFTGQTVGPLDAPDEERLAALFTQVDMLDLRDTASFELFVKENVNVQVTIDDAFVNSVPMRKFAASDFQSLSSLPHVNICFQRWSLPPERQQAYDAALRETVTFLNRYHQENPDVHFFLLEFEPFDHDMELSEQIMGSLSASAQNVCHKICLANYYVGETIQLLQTARFNLGTRFHMALYSMVAHVPAVSLILDDYYFIKLHGVHSLFGSENYLKLDQYTTDAVYQMHTIGPRKEAWRSINAKRHKKLREFYHCVAPQLSLPARVRLHHWLTKRSS